GALSWSCLAPQIGVLSPVRIVETSPHQRGQIYVPAVNWALGAACIGVVRLFGGSAGLAAAYGVAVTATMAITSVLFALVARQHLGWPFLSVVPLVAVFLVVDLGYFAANLLK